MNRLFDYLRESRAELAKVVWPSRPQAIRLTAAVIVFAIALAAIVGSLDYVFNLGLQKLIIKG